jgi:addiction module HigA family antidote
MAHTEIINTHPGEVLREEFLLPMRLSQRRLALELHMPCRRINEIVRERRNICADTALRLAKFFGTTPEFWLNLQRSYDLVAAQQIMGSELKYIRSLNGCSTA